MSLEEVKNWTTTFIIILLVTMLCNLGLWMKRKLIKDSTFWKTVHSGVTLVQVLLSVILIGLSIWQISLQ